MVFERTNGKSQLSHLFYVSYKELLKTSCNIRVSIPQPDRHAPPGGGDRAVPPSTQIFGKNALFLALKRNAWRLSLVLLGEWRTAPLFQ